MEVKVWLKRAISNDFHNHCKKQEKYENQRYQVWTFLRLKFENSTFVISVARLTAGNCSDNLWFEITFKLSVITAPNAKLVIVKYWRLILTQKLLSSRFRGWTLKLRVIKILD